MVAPIPYPSAEGLPGPDSVAFRPAEGRVARNTTASSNGSGGGALGVGAPATSGQRILERIYVFDVSFTFTSDEFDIWSEWYAMQTAQGQRKVSMQLVGPSGFVERVLKFTGPVQVEYLPGGLYRVGATLESAL